MCGYCFGVGCHACRRYEVDGWAPAPEDSGNGEEEYIGA